MRFAVLAVLLAASSAQAGARKPLRKPAPHVRPEDDPRRKGDSKAFAAARVAFETPTDRENLPEGDVAVVLSVTGYALGGGPHLHLIVDNEPALELDEDGAYVLHGLIEGPHVVRAVLCRPWHEVVKAPRAFALARFWIGPKLAGKAGQAAEYVAWPDPKKPLLTQVLPIGQERRSFELWRSNGETVLPPHGPEHPVLDFYVSGTKLARRGSKVRVVLDKRELPLVTQWKPERLPRARAGVHALTVDLLDRRGLKVHNAVNRTDRTFTASAK